MTDTASPTLDAAVLAALADSVGGDVEFVADLIGTYLDDGAEQVAAIDAAIAAGDAATLVRPAHTLKSASYTVGAMRLGDIARSLEQRGRAGDLAGAEPDRQAARTEWPAVVAALRPWLAAGR